MTDEQKKQLILQTEEHGVHKLFEELGIEVTVNGSNIYCVCPFHEGADNPNGFCYTNGFGGYCFTNCHRRYDLFDVIMKLRNVNFIGAVTYLADFVGVEIDLNSAPPQYTERSNRNFLATVKRTKAKLEQVKVAPLSNYWVESYDRVMHKKLREDGFNEDVREYFDLGYARDGYFAQRIVIPIDHTVGVVTLSGRSVLSTEELQRHRIAKYKHLAEVEKTYTLYNISRALPYVEFTGEIFVFEGFKSCWRMYQWGYGNTVATMGSSISEEQKRLLLQMNCKIIVCGDRDKAGVKFNNNVCRAVQNFADVEVMDLHLIDVPEKSSIDDVEKEQFLYLCQNKVVK